MSQMTVKDIYDTFDDEQKYIANWLVGEALELSRFRREYLVMFSDEQKKLVYALINAALKGG